MRRPIPQHRGRVLVSLTAAAGLCLGLAAVSTGPATSAEPSGDCAVAYPVDELTLSPG